MAGIQNGGTVGRHRREGAFSNVEDEIDPHVSAGEPHNNINNSSSPPFAALTTSLGSPLQANVITLPTSTAPSSILGDTRPLSPRKPTLEPAFSYSAKNMPERRPSGGAESSISMVDSPERRKRVETKRGSVASTETGSNATETGGVGLGLQSKGISRGIESELEAANSSPGVSLEPSLAKRRSIFRGAGTASTPDLNSAAARHARSPQTALNRPPVAMSNRPSAAGNAIGRVDSNQRGSVERPDVLVATPSQQTTGSSSANAPPSQPSNLSSASASQARGRAASHGAALHATNDDFSGWEKVKPVENGRQNSGGIGASGTMNGKMGKAQAHPEGHLSMGKRARGMFGRLFSSGGKDNQNSPQQSLGTQRSQPQSRPTVMPSPVLSSPRVAPPPVPNLPTEYQRDRPIALEAPMRLMSIDLLDQAQNRSSSPPVTRRMSATPTNIVDVYVPTAIPADAPAAAASSNEVETSESSSALSPTKRATRHVREAGTHGDVESAPFADAEEREVIVDGSGVGLGLPSGLAGDSTPQRNMRKWTQDLEGMIDGDGIDDNLAMGLGLPSSSMRVRSSSPVPQIPLESQGSPLQRRTSTRRPVPALSPRTTSLAVMETQLPDPTRTPRTADDEETDGAATLGLSTDSAPSKLDGFRARTPSQASTYTPPVSGTATNSAFSSQKGSADPTIMGAIPEPRASASEGYGSHERTATGESGTITSGGTPNGSTFAVPAGLAEVKEDSSYNGSPKVDLADSTIQDDLELQAKRMAEEFLDGDDTHVANDKIAEYLGSVKPIGRATLKHYMQGFDFAGLRLDDAFRKFCQKLYLKAETQEIDRILEGFSERYYTCNPNTIFGSPTVIHVVTGSFLLLNTDLHIADIAQHMSRSQFTKLTLDTIYANIGNTQQSMRSSTPDLVRDDSSSSLRHSLNSHPISASNSQMSGTTVAAPRGQPIRASSVYSGGSGNDGVGLGLPVGSGNGGMDQKPRLSSAASVASSYVYAKGWEGDVESALKEIYNAVRSSQILLPVGAPLPKVSTSPYGQRRPMSNMSSRPASNNSSMDRLNQYKRGSIRGVGSLLSAGGPYGDGRNSPTPSYATSIGDGYQHQYLAPPSLGFASNLSHTVIREQEDEAGSAASITSDSTVEDLSDDELALLGAPWAKEGNLQRKPYWDGPHKRSKDKNWKGVFVVIQKGDLHMFTFGEGSSSISSGGMGGGVGGGNWMKNARDKGEMNLSHSLASSLPPPGYNASRPHCFSLTLPNGEMSFFQAGTDELVQEWVQTCNYWAARRSRPPLQGGVGNLEYGWKSLEDGSVGGVGGGGGDDNGDRDETRSVMSNRSGRSRMSIQHTLGRRTFNSGVGSGLGSGGGYGGGNGGGGGDRVHIADWKAPQASLIPSPLEEEAQMEALQRHIVGLRKELDHHKSFEEPMGKLFPPRSTQLTKAKDNWRNKSLFIHSEIVKYETYVDCLKHAITLRLKRQGEKKLERSLQRGLVEMDEDDDDEDGGMEMVYREMMITPVPRGEED